MDERYEDGPWVVVREMDDPIAARMAADVLREAGIPHRLEGLHHRETLGALGNFVRVPIKVPEARALDARALLATFDRGSVVATDDEDASTASDRHPWRAVGIALLGPSICLSVGLGQFYVRRTLAGVILLIAPWIALYASRHGIAAWPAVPALVVVDAWTAARLAREPHRRNHELLVVFLVLLVLLVSPWIARVLPEIDAFLLAPRRRS